MNRVNRNPKAALEKLKGLVGRGSFEGLISSPGLVDDLVSLYQGDGSRFLRPRTLDELRAIVERQPDDPFYSVLTLAAEVNRDVRKGSDKCGSFYADVRPCEEDCSFCPLSKEHYQVLPNVKQPSWPELPEAIHAFAKRAYAAGVRHFKIVTTGAKTDPKIFPFIAEGVKYVKNGFPDMTVCISEGTLGKASLRTLREAGVDIFNNNLETSRKRFPSLVSTHSYDEKIKAIRDAKSVGMKICSGGLFGIGETLSERAELFLTLARLGVDSSPFNLFVQFPALPLTKKLKSTKYDLSKRELAYSVALFRLINPRTRLVLGAGRQDRLTERDQAFLLLIGASALASSGYLSKKGLVFDRTKDDRIFEFVGQTGDAS